MLTRVLATASALLLGICGATLLFAADEILARIGGPPAPASILVGQLLGAAWLAVAAATWLARGAVLGGIYGRAVVMANTWLFTITALVGVRAAWIGSMVWATTAIAAAFAVAYAYLLVRGPVGAAK